eukprot:1185808-Prorocentrum_minimum.AAC.3
MAPQTALPIPTQTSLQAHPVTDTTNDGNSSSAFDSPAASGEAIVLLYAETRVRSSCFLRLLPGSFIQVDISAKACLQNGRA